MMRLRRPVMRVIALFCCWRCAGLLQAQTLDPKFPVIELPGEACDFALDPTSGHLAVAGLAPSEVLVYPLADLNPARPPKPTRIEVMGRPLSLIAKTLAGERMFVVGVEQPPSLIVIDAQTLAIKRRLLLNIFPPARISASGAPDDPFIFFTPRANRATIARFDLKRLSPAGTLPPEFTHVSVSGDGTILYRFGGANSKDYPTAAAKWPENAPRGIPANVEYLGQREGSNDQVYADPTGQFAAVGPTLMDSTLTEVYSQFEFHPQAFLEGTPWMAGLGGSSWMVGSINDFSVHARIPLPPEWFPKRDRANPANDERLWPRAVSVIADPQRRRFVLATPKRVVVFPLSALELNEQDALWVSNEFPAEVVAGTPFEWSLGLDARVSMIELSRAPTGMTVEGQTLRWTPSLQQVGHHTIQVAVQTPEVTHNQAWSVRVKRPAIPITFVPSVLAIAGDGSQALAWGESAKKADYRVLYSRLAVIDLGNDTVLCDRRLSEPFYQAVTTGVDIYVRLKTGLARLRASDLEVLNSIELEDTRFRLPRITLIGDRRLELSNEEDDYARPQGFLLPELKPVPGFAHDINKPSEWLSGRGGQGWMDAGVLWDPQLEQALIMPWPVTFRWHPFAAHLTYIPGLKQQVSINPTGWYPWWHKSDLSQRERELRTETPDLPVVLAAKTSPDLTTLEALERGSGRTLAQIGLYPRQPQKVDDRRRRNVIWDPGPTKAIATAGDHCLVLTHSELIHCRLSELGALTAPFVIDPRQSTFVLATDKPNQVKYTAAGARRFRLDSREFGTFEDPVHMESLDGTFTLTLTPEIVQRRIDGLAGLLVAQMRESDNGARLAKYIEATQDEFTRIVGRPPDGVPLPIHVFVTAEGPELELCTIAHDYLIEVPVEQVAAGLYRKSAGKAVKK